jgi:uncharacterized protein YodC (DUF2158 family)
MKESELKVGAVVQLNSGGASMTVLAWEKPDDSDDPIVSCTWVADGGVQFADDFPLPCLQPVVDERHPAFASIVQGIVRDMKARGSL